ncbi:actin-like protein arp8 [Dissophora globulifera]|nr:actin-like protein arp8 [Dissophora globulifera]
MEDVHMEDAGPTTPAVDTLNPDSSSTLANKQNTTTSSTTTTAAAAAGSASSEQGDASSHAATNAAPTSNINDPNVSQSASSMPSELSKATDASTTRTTAVGERGGGSAVVRNGSMMMDVDATTPAGNVKSEASSSTLSHDLGSNGVASEAPQDTKEGSAVDQSLTTKASSTEASSATEPTAASASSHNAADTIASNTDQPTVASNSSIAQPASDIKPTLTAAADTPSTTEATQPQQPPATPARTYVPQFKFTTFSAMTVLPTRNVTSNFLKTEKNFVLKDLSAKPRRRKRKVGEDTTKTEDNQGGEGKEGDAGGEGMEKEKVEGEEEYGVRNGVMKKTRSDEFSSIRRGAEDNDDDDDDNNSTGQDKDEEEGMGADHKEDEDDDSSDSDSEVSVVNETDENGEAKSSSNVGKKIIVIHPGSRILRIGRASDAYPVATPHCIARRLHVKPVATPGTDGPAESSTADAAQTEDQEMDVDGDGEGDDDDGEVPDVVNDRYLEEIEYDLKLRMKAAKRRPMANAKQQQRSFNSSSEPERILDHNDPYKVEWTDPAAEGEYIIGQKALNLPLSKDHTFKLFWPIVGGKLNDQDYVTPRVVVADLETIWTKVIQDDLGIDPKKFRKHYAILVIPDLYSKVYVTELVTMLLKSMHFRGVIIQQESVCASYGAGVSTACVVDIGAEVTKVSCVEDGICIPNSRAVLKYGGDDITRCFTALIKRAGFPYHELDLAQTYDWRLMEELKEKWCTMNEADLTVQVYNFFVRRPEKQTEKYQLKVYDEVAISPMCLFFPGVIRRWIQQREINPSFAKVTNYEDINEDAPPISLMNQSAKKNTAAAAAVAAAARAGTPSSTVPGDDNVGNGVSNVGTPNATPAATPGPSGAAGMVGAAVATAIATAAVVVPFAMEPSVTTTDNPWEVAGTIGKDNFSSLVALDVVAAQSISNCGSEERSKKLYGSIILVGGGGLIKGFNRVLEDRLFQALPATLTTVEKVEVLPSPRDMDPRLLVWKGASVLGKLEMAKELWVKPLEWEHMGRKVLRDKSLFVWSKD